MGEPWGAEQLWEVLVSPSGWAEQGSAQPQAWSSTGKPGKAAEHWSWEASEEATDGEPCCVINIAAEPGFACADVSPQAGSRDEGSRAPGVWEWPRHRNGDAGSTSVSSWQSPAWDSWFCW